MMVRSPRSAYFASPTPSLFAFSKVKKEEVLVWVGGLQEDGVSMDLHC